MKSYAHILFQPADGSPVTIDGRPRPASYGVNNAARVQCKRSEYHGFHPANEVCPLCDPGPPPPVRTRVYVHFHVSQNTDGSYKVGVTRVEPAPRALPTS